MKWNRSMNGFMMPSKKGKKLWSLLICVMMLLCTLPALRLEDVRADEPVAGPDTMAEGYCVMDAKTGEVICEKNMDTPYYPASITKILTALVVYEHIGRSQLSDQITFSYDAVVTNLPSNSSTLKPKAVEGEVITVDDALHGMIMPSANECANALAEYVAGSNAAFTDMMNAKVAELGLSNTHFLNPSGVDMEGHYTTAYDMALIMKAAMENEQCRALLSCKEYVIPQTNKCAARSLHAGHSMVYGDYPYEGFIAGKGGKTTLAGRTLVTYVDQDDYELITVLLKGELTRAFFDVQMLYDFSFGYLRGELPEVSWEEREEEVWPIQESADVYEFANTCSIKVAVLTENDHVICNGKYDKWYRIDLGGANYYVLAEDMTNGKTWQKPERETTEEYNGENPFYESVEDPVWEGSTAVYESTITDEIDNHPVLTIVGNDHSIVGSVGLVGIIALVGVICLVCSTILLISSILDLKRRKRARLERERREQNRRNIREHRSKNINR